jgi:hypothetical protein
MNLSKLTKPNAIFIMILIMEYIVRTIYIVTCYIHINCIQKLYIYTLD